MLPRITLMFFIIAALCSSAFMLGSRAQAGRQDSSGIPPEHALMLALRYPRELGLSSDQLDGLQKMHDEMAKEFEPLRVQAESLQRQMRDLQQTGKPDESIAKGLQREGDAVGAKMQPLFERYANAVGALLSPEQREKLMKLSEANSHQAQGNEFPLMVVLQSREQLEISPKQFTKLQYLQADFIRAFAPLREQMELLQADVQAKFGKLGKEPTLEYRNIGMGLQKQIAALQAQYSERAAKDVLEPKQRAKLEELLHGERRSAPNRP